MRNHSRPPSSTTSMYSQTDCAAITSSNVQKHDDDFGKRPSGKTCCFPAVRQRERVCRQIVVCGLNVMERPSSSTLNSGVLECVRPLGHRRKDISLRPAHTYSTYRLEDKPSITYTRRPHAYCHAQCRI